MSNQPRVSKGVPTGGEWTTAERADSGVSLASPTTATAPHPAQTTVDAVLENLASRQHDDGYVAGWFDSMSAAQSSGRKQALKTWLENQTRVDTLQCKLREHSGISGWGAQGRDVDTSAATYARFDGSRRDFAGLECLYADDKTWVGWDKDMDTLVMHRTAQSR